MKLFKAICHFLIVLPLLLTCCINKQNAKTKSIDSDQDSIFIDTLSNESKSDLEIILSKSLSDGFDFPVGDSNGKGTYIFNSKKYNGWYIAVKTGESYELGIYTGEDWNGNGGGNTYRGQPVYSISNGKIIEAYDFGKPWGKVVFIEHYFLENAKLKKVYSLYAHLDSIMITKGNFVTKREQIGTIGNAEGMFAAHLHFEIRKDSMETFPVTYWPSSDGKDVNWIFEHYEKPSDFIASHRTLTCPFNESQIFLAFKDQYKMYQFKKGKVQDTFEIALSQNPIGHKERQGDNRLPEGEYRIIQKAKGPIGGDWGEYFGAAWIRLNYPNNYDARIGYQKGLITESQMNSILNANDHNQWPPKSTKLGGGIGIHGWYGNWDLNGSRHLTWGCISMQNNDLELLFDQINLNDKVLIFQ